MTNVDSSSLVRAELRNKTNEFLSATKWLAQMYWQDASPYLKRKYPLYALTTEEFVKSARNWDHELGDAICAWAVRVLQDSIGWWDDPDETITPRIAGELLAEISYVRVSAGEPACQGDIEFFIRQWEKIWVADPEMMGPRQMYKYYLTCDRGLLLQVMNIALKYSVQEVYRVSKRQRIPVEDLTYFSREPRYSGHRINKGYVNTNYQLLCSLLRFLEGPGGHT
jgi:hypothetical protein